MTKDCEEISLMM